MLKFLQLFTLVLAFGLLSPPAASAGGPPVTADAALLMDAATGQVLYMKNERHRKDPASLTKIMTAIVALEAGNRDDVVTISPRAARFHRGSIVDIRDGEQITLDNLLRAALTMSANDATIAIGEHVGGDYETFVRWMNLKAQAIGARDTRFTNTHGFTEPNHKTTAYDLGLITRYALRNPVFAQMVGAPEATIRWHESNRQVTVSNTNRLLRSNYPGVDGVKTGTTSAAGHCLVASATRDGRQLIAVVLHSDARYQDTRKLLDYGFEMPPLTAVYRHQQVRSVAVRGGVAAQVPAVAAQALTLYIPAEQEPRLRKRIHLRTSVEAPVAQGQELGRMDFILDGVRLGSVPLVAGADVARASLFKRWCPEFVDKQLRLRYI